MNDAIVTVWYKGEQVSFSLDGDELAPVGTQSDHRYLTNASRGFIADEVEKALIYLTTPRPVV
jgi:hypothetical protein